METPLRHNQTTHTNSHSLRGTATLTATVLALALVSATSATAAQSHHKAKQGKKAAYERTLSKLPNSGTANVASWFGICHAWVPGAACCQADEAAFVGGKCDGKRVKRRKSGQVKSSCRDINPGAYHIALTNLVGLQSRAFVEDRTYDSEVWNQPVVGYWVKITKVTPKQAMAALGQKSDTYAYNNKAVTLYVVDAKVTYVRKTYWSTAPQSTTSLKITTTTDTSQYVLEVDGDGQVKGGQWSGKSVDNHPDFLWLPTATIHVGMGVAPKSRMNATTVVVSAA